MKTIKFLLVMLFNIAVAACGNGNSGGNSGGGGAPTDSIAPTVSSTNPANNATGVAVNSVITVTFSEMMDASTITTATFTLDNGVTGTVTYADTTATFTQTGQLASNTTYTATITTNANDAAGNAMAANHEWTFTTAQPLVGSLDTSFDTDGKLTTAFGTGNDEATAIALQSDGKIVAAGHSRIGTNKVFALTRYNTDGSLDTSFDTDGKVTTAIGTREDFSYAIAIQSDGKIVAAGTSWNGTVYVFALARYHTDGSLDTSFDTDGKLTTAIGTSHDEALAIALQSDDKIVVAGFSFNGANNDFALARYSTDGSLDTSFDTDGKLTTAIGTSGDVARAIAIQSDGKIVLAGTSDNGINTGYDMALARYNTDGSLDISSFGVNGKRTAGFGIDNDDVARAIAIQSDGKIVLAGTSDSGNSPIFALVRYHTNGYPDTSFDTDGQLTTAFGTDHGIARAIAIQSDGKIVAAGYAYTGDPWKITNSVFALARYNTNGSLDTSFDTDGKRTTAIGTGYDYANAIAIQPDGKIVAAGYSAMYSSSGATYDFALVRYWP